MNLEVLIPELSFKAIRSSGSGGQHINKVASKVELQFDILNSNLLSKDQKQLLFKTLKTRLTNKNKLVLQCDQSRSQHKNKELVIKRFFNIIEQGLVIPKKRIRTKIPKIFVKKRLDDKKIQSGKKSKRMKPDMD